MCDYCAIVDKTIALKFSKLLKQNNIDGFIVTNPVNIFYLCSFRGISPTEREALLIFNPKPTLITARLYQNEANALESKGLAIKIANERTDRLSTRCNFL